MHDDTLITITAITTVIIITIMIILKSLCARHEPLYAAAYNMNKGGRRSAVKEKKKKRQKKTKNEDTGEIARRFYSVR